MYSFSLRGLRVLSLMIGLEKLRMNWESSGSFSLTGERWRECEWRKPFFVTSLFHGLFQCWSGPSECDPYNGLLLQLVGKRFEKHQIISNTVVLFCFLKLFLKNLEIKHLFCYIVLRKGYLKYADTTCQLWCHFDLLVVQNRWQNHFPLPPTFSFLPHYLPL